MIDQISQRQVVTRILKSAIPAAAVIACFASSALADVTVEATGLESKLTLPSVAITGEIKQGDADRLAAILPTLEANSRKVVKTYTGVPYVRVHLNSLGGDVIEAEKIGHLVRSHFLFTWTGQGDTCASACIFILAAGVDRYVVMPAAIVLHRPYFDPVNFAGLGAKDAMQRYNAMLSDVGRYLADMGMPSELFQEMKNVPSQIGRALTEQEIDQFGLKGTDAAWAEFQHASLIKQYGAKSAAHIEHCQMTTGTMAEITACMERQ